MIYTKMTFEIPVGYEDQIYDIVITKLTGIVSTIDLSPTKAQKEKFTTDLKEVKDKNPKHQNA